MKVIDLKDRTLFVDDIIQLYIEEKYSPERYNIQTTNGIYLVYKEDYFKVKDYLLSLNDEVKEDLKIYELEQQLQQKENIIKEVREWAKKCSCQFTNDDGELVVSEISFNIQARPCDLFKILDKGEINVQDKD